MTTLRTSGMGLKTWESGTLCNPCWARRLVRASIWGLMPPTMGTSCPSIGRSSRSTEVSRLSLSCGNCRSRIVAMLPSLRRTKARRRINRNSTTARPMPAAASTTPRHRPRRLENPVDRHASPKRRAGPDGHRRQPFQPDIATDPPRRASSCLRIAGGRGGGVSCSRVAISLLFTDRGQFRKQL